MYFQRAPDWASDRNLFSSRCSGDRVFSVGLKPLVLEIDATNTDRISARRMSREPILTQDHEVFEVLPKASAKSLSDHRRNRREKIPIEGSIFGPKVKSDILVDQSVLY